MCFFFFFFYSKQLIDPGLDPGLLYAPIHSKIQPQMHHEPNLNQVQP